ncbi:MAG: hypothetical protein ACFFAS_15550 [Promethearchaeota archaeon]
MNDKDTCCECGHELSLRFDESKGWRCHRLGPDGFQCECWLSKAKAEGSISYYSLTLRIKDSIDDLKGLKKER